MELLSIAVFIVGTTAPVEQTPLPRLRVKAATERLPCSDEGGNVYHCRARTAEDLAEALKEQLD